MTNWLHSHQYPWSPEVCVGLQEETREHTCLDMVVFPQSSWTVHYGKLTTQWLWHVSECIQSCLGKDCQMLFTSFLKRKLYFFAEWLSQVPLGLVEFAHCLSWCTIVKFAYSFVIDLATSSVFSLVSHLYAVWHPASESWLQNSIAFIKEFLIWHIADL